MGSSAESGAEQVSPTEWWGSQRLRYNLHLTISFLAAAVCAMLLLFWLNSMSATDPARANWLVPATAAATGYVLLMAAANVCYFLGPLSERVVRPRHLDRYRRITFRLGLWFSMLVPFAAPAFLLCFGLLGVVMGEGTPVSASELPGTYVADYGAARSTLTLAADGRFSQEVRVKTTGEAAASSGTWDSDPAHRDLYFADGFMGVVDYKGDLIPDLGRPPKNTTAVLRARRTAWALELGGDDIPWNRGPAETPYTKQMSQTRR
jgi:hypothetical protein